MSKPRTISPFRLACLALVLLIGAATNALVAWAGYIAESSGSPIAPTFQRFLEPSRGEPDGVFMANFDDQRFRTRVICHLATGSGTIEESKAPEDVLPGWLAAEVSARVRRHEPNMKASSWTFNYQLAGWPLRALKSSNILVSDASLSAMQALPESVGEWFLPPNWAQRLHTQSLPIGIIWPGFLANSALFAFGWCAIGFAVLTITRSRRRASGLCPHCAYNLSATPANAPCPECGTLTTSREGT